MATRKKRKQRTIQLLATSALLSSVVAPYVIHAEDLPAPSQEKVNTLTNQTFAVTSTDSSTVVTSNDTAQLTVFDQLQPGNYQIGFVPNKNAMVFKLHSNLSVIPTEVKVTEDKKYRVTLHLNRINLNSTLLHTITVSQGDAVIPSEVLNSFKKGDLDIPVSITFEVTNLNNPIILTAKNAKDVETITELTFNETEIVNTDAAAVPSFSKIADGLYDIEIDTYMQQGNQFIRPETTNNLTALPQAQLEVRDGKHFLIAQFKGYDFIEEDKAEFSYFVSHVTSVLNPWASGAQTEGALLHYDETTHITTIKFQVFDPFTYNQIFATRTLYNVEPQKIDGSMNVFIQAKADSLKKVADITPLAIGHYITKVAYRNISTDGNASKAIASLGTNVNIQLKADKKIVTIGGLDTPEAQYKLTDVSSPYLKETLKDDMGYIYALTFELPLAEEDVPLTITLLDRSKDKIETLEIYADVNEAALTKVDEPLSFNVQPKHVPVPFPYEDGEYTVNVRLIADTLIAPVSKNDAASGSAAFSDAKLTVQDVNMTLSGTLKNIGSWTYPINPVIENSYGSLTYSPVLITREVDKTTGNFTQDISFPITDLAGLYRFKYDLQGQTMDRNMGTGYTRISIDMDSIKPFEAPADPGVDLPYTVTPDETNEMGAFIANYLSPYFEKPAKFKIEDGVAYAYVTVSGKMYVANADKFRYVAANGTEHPVEVVSDNGLSGLELVRTVRFPIHQEQMKLFVDSGSYGEYYLYTNFDLSNVELPESTPNPSEPVTPPDIDNGDNNAENPETPKPEVPAAPTGITHNFTAVEVTPGIYGSAPGSFIENYLKPYFTNAQLVTVDGEKYIELTLSGKAYGVSSFEGAEIVSSVGEKLDQVRVIRIPAAKTSTHRVNAGDYGIYDLTFTFDVTDEQLADAPEENKPAPAKPVIPAPQTPSIPSTNEIVKDISKFKLNVPTTILFALDTKNKLAKLVSEMIQAPKAKRLSNNEMEITFTIAPKPTIKRIFFFQHGKKIGEWKAATTARVASITPLFANTEEQITLKVDSTEGITFEVEETNGTVTQVETAIEAKKSALTSKTPNKVSSGGGGGSSAVNTQVNMTPTAIAIPSTGAAQFQLLVSEANKNFAQHINHISSTAKNGLYNVEIELNTANDLTKFIVKQEGKVIATWDKAKNTAKLASLFNWFGTNKNTALLSFETASLDGLTFEAVTSDQTLSAGVEANLTEAEKPTNQTVAINYTMEADPAGPMADFIGGYLAPYFSNAKLATIDNKQYIELTLTGKAYGFQQLNYIDATGKQQHVEVVSSTGEKMDQVRVIRFPLVQDKQGISKIFVDSGDFGYGAYTLFFKFDIGLNTEDVVTETPNATAPVRTNPFTDIAKTGNVDEIVALYYAGITEGTSATTFSPSKNITRAQFAVMIARALNVKSTNETSFKDVKGKWYAEHVQALKEVGIINGTSDTTFDPSANISRQQAAAMIYRMLAYKGYEGSANGQLNYSDSYKIADYAKEALAELQVQNVMTGSNGAIKPGDALTRSQMAKILKRSLDLVNYEF